MGLKFQKDNSLDRRFDDFAFFPEDSDQKKEENTLDIERFLKESELEEKKEKEE